MEINELVIGKSGHGIHHFTAAQCRAPIVGRGNAAVTTSSVGKIPRRKLSGQAVQPPQLLYHYNMNPSYAMRKIKEAIAREEKRAEVILYGSRAHGTEVTKSDWAILVLLDKPEVSFKD
jgi:hypothetical protein